MLYVVLIPKNPNKIIISITYGNPKFLIHELRTSHKDDRKQYLKFIYFDKDLFEICGNTLLRITAFCLRERADTHKEL